MDLIWQLRNKFITDNINLVIDDVFIYVCVFSCLLTWTWGCFAWLFPSVHIVAFAWLAAILWLWIVTCSRTYPRFQSLSTGSWTLSPFTPFCVFAPLSINYSIENNYLIVDFSWFYVLIQTWLMFSTVRVIVEYVKHTAFSWGCYGRLPHEKNVYHQTSREW